MVIENFDETLTFCKIEEDDVFFDDTDVKQYKVFLNRYLRYYINDKLVAQAQLFDYNGRIKRITTTKEKGLNERQVEDLRRSYGKGAMEIERPHWYIILVKEATRPLYLFLFFSVALWYS